MNPCCRFGDVVELDDIDHIKVDDIEHFAVLVVRNRNPVLEVLKYFNLSLTQHISEPVFTN